LGVTVIDGRILLRWVSRKHGDRVWIDLEDRAQWWIVVNTVMNFLLP
jgi:hypothetical protein